MKLRTWILIALLPSIWGCGDDDSPAGPGPDDDDPIPTAAGDPDGSATAATIGAEGGELASSDGLFTISIPAGALAADTEIGIQPITNMAWGGRGKGYRLTPDGLSFGAVVSVTFSLGEDLLAGSDPSLADIAVQRDDGVWGVLKNRTLDTTAQTITCTTGHFSDYSLIEGIQIRPPAAVVDVNQHVALSVLYCGRETIEGDPDLASLLISCDAEAVPLGTFENWSVNGAVGGNGTVGTVSPTSGLQVGYTAPAQIPTPNVVAVSVQTTFQGNSALLASTIRISGLEQWEGTFISYDSSGDHAEGTVTWAQTGTFGTIKFFAPTGSVLYTLGASDCAFVSLFPNTGLIADTDGVLLVDYATDPPTYSGGVGIGWQAEHCYQCPKHPVQCGTIGLGGAWASKGEVSGDGTRIEGIIVDENLDPVSSFNFVKGSPPLPEPAR